MSTTNYRKEFREMLAFCRTLTDEQVLNVVEREHIGATYNEDRIPHWDAALHEAEVRGLVVQAKFETLKPQE